MKVTEFHFGVSEPAMAPDTYMYVDLRKHRPPLVAAELLDRIQGRKSV